MRNTWLCAMALVCMAATVACTGETMTPEEAAKQQADDDLESQLFGHTRGAFSGALRDEPGLFREADQGTLVLDEIGELPATAQAGLLRVLQEREVLPVGASRPVPVDVRIVAATLKPIGTATDFRSDLYARVAAHVHAAAPVRERIQDIGIFVAHILARIVPEDRVREVQLAPEVVDRFVCHPWPMNVRELENVLAVAVQLATEGSEIKIKAVARAFADAALEKGSSSTPPNRSRPARSGPVTLSDEERARRGR